MYKNALLHLHDDIDRRTSSRARSRAQFLTVASKKKHQKLRIEISAAKVDSIIGGRMAFRMGCSKLLQIALNRSDSLQIALNRSTPDTKKHQNLAILMLCFICPAGPTNEVSAERCSYQLCLTRRRKTKVKGQK